MLIIFHSLCKDFSVSSKNLTTKQNSSSHIYGSPDQSVLGRDTKLSKKISMVTQKLIDWWGRQGGNPVHTKTDIRFHFLSTLTTIFFPLQFLFIKENRSEHEFQVTAKFRKVTLLRGRYKWILIFKSKYDYEEPKIRSVTRKVLPIIWLKEKKEANFVKIIPFTQFRSFNEEIK